MKEPKIALIIVNYNQQHFLDTCLDSIFGQTYKNIDVYFIDNNSPDTAYLKFLTKKYPFKEVIANKENLGYPTAANQGMRLAKDADYIVVTNPDIIYSPSYIEKIVHRIQKRSTHPSSHRKNLQIRFQRKNSYKIHRHNRFIYRQIYESHRRRPRLPRQRPIRPRKRSVWSFWRMPNLQKRSIGSDQSPKRIFRRRFLHVQRRRRSILAHATRWIQITLLPKISRIPRTRNRSYRTSNNSPNLQKSQKTKPVPKILFIPKPTFDVPQKRPMGNIPQIPATHFTPRHHDFCVRTSLRTIPIQSDLRVYKNVSAFH